jgi:hypothetical protein
MSNIKKETDEEGNIYYTSKHCVYSCDEDDDLDEIAFEGKCFIYQKPDGFFSQNGYISPTLTNPTYRDIFALCDDIVETTGDYHHHFFEGVSNFRKINNNLYQFDVCLGS